MDYLTAQRAPWVAPETVAPGQREFTPIWQEIVHFVKSQRFWENLPKALPVEPLATAHKDGALVHYSLKDLMHLTYMLCDAAYSDSKGTTPEAYAAWGRQWTENYYVLGLKIKQLILGLPPERYTTPLHIWTTHASAWATLPTVTLCGQGGEHSHQSIKTLVARHWKLGTSSKNIQLCFQKDISAAADKIAKLH